VGLQIPCPRCGPREQTEFLYGGEDRPIDLPDPTEDFRAVYLRENGTGPQRERWYHRAGCRRWLTIDRDATTDRIGDA
jgi:heterotetrameric sarcosine oxidase delta subunit